MADPATLAANLRTTRGMRLRLTNSGRRFVFLYAPCLLYSFPWASCFWEGG